MLPARGVFYFNFEMVSVASMVSKIKGEAHEIS
jgi:hypothetical protein